MVITVLDHNNNFRKLWTNKYYGYNLLRPQEIWIKSLWLYLGINPIPLQFMNSRCWFLLLFFNAVSDLHPYITILLIDPHMLQSETNMRIARKGCFVILGVIFACVQLFLSRLPSKIFLGDRFMYMIGLLPQIMSIKI